MKQDVNTQNAAVVEFHKGFKRERKRENNDI